jgi:hypothetical protein
MEAVLIKMRSDYLMDKIFNMIFNPKESTKVIKPKFPVIIALDGYIYEAASIAAAVQLVIKSSINEDYLDSESEETKWHMRVLAARKYVMLAAMDDKDAIVFDTSYGRIKENYAADENDPDYEDDFKGEPVKITVDNELEFVKSLANLEAIGVWIREDYDCLKPDIKAEDGNRDVIREGGRFLSLVGEEEIIY